MRPDPTPPPLRQTPLRHHQQAAEKALKGFLAWHDQPFRKTHDLTELGQQCVHVDFSLEPLCHRAAQLTVYAWIFRYPGEPETPSHEEVAKALALTRELIQGIHVRLPEVM